MVDHPLQSLAAYSRFVAELLDRSSVEHSTVLQGMYSETAQAWVQDERVWEALQVFLLDHRSHPLRFESDEDNSALDEYVEVELDVLLHKREGVRMEST